MISNAEAGASRRHRGKVLGVLAAVAALALSGCAAGQITQTDAQLPAVNGATAAIGDLRINNAKLAYPEGEERAYRQGDDAPVQMRIANNGTTDDQLESVSTEAASDVAISGDQLIMAGRALTIGEAVVRAADEDAEDAEEGSDEIGTAQITLSGLTHDLLPGQVIIVTLTFREAGAIDVRMPIGAPDRERDPVDDEAGH